MKIMVLTFESLRTADAERRAGVNMLLKYAGRRCGLKCVGIEEREAKPKRAARAKKPEQPAALNIADINKRMREPDFRR